MKVPHVYGPRCNRKGEVGQGTGGVASAPRLFVCLAAFLALTACAGPRIVADPAFPVMSPAQVEAMERARQVEPDLNEWWVRYIKAWCKTAPELCE